MPKPTKLDFVTLRKAVEPLVGDRVALAGLFDAALASRESVGEAAQPISFIHAVTLGTALAAEGHVEFDPAIARDALALALLSVGETQFVFSMLNRAITRGFADAPGATAEAIETNREANSDRLANLLFTKQEATAELQRKTSSDVIFARPQDLASYVAQAEIRICRIMAKPAVGEAELGTGFLIGPSCVLTNWHVVEKLTAPKLAETEQLVVEFDFLQEKSTRPRIENQFVAHKNWLVAKSMTGSTEPVNAAQHRKLEAGTVVEDWWMDDAIRRAWCDRLDNSLDFAVIRLEGSPGARRAQFNLWPEGAPATSAPTSAECFVLHHANAQGQAMNTGRTYARLAHGTRLFHSASTERGSSGAMLFDVSSGRPIGLHYLGLGSPVAAGTEPVVPECIVNVAVSLEAIAAEIERQGQRQAIALASELMFHTGCLDNGDPVFGRRDILANLTEMRTGARQILWIIVPNASNGPINYGRSYTTRIIESLFPQPASLHIKIDAADIPSDAQTLVRLLAERVVNDSAAADTLEVPAKETAAEAYDKVLFEYFADLVLRYRRENTIWLVLDDLDVHDLPDTDSRRFLDRLYAQIATIPQLRIVLIGLKFQLQSIDEKRLAKNTIELHDLTTLERPLSDWLDERTATVGPLNRMAREVVASLSMSGVKSGDAMRELHVFARDRLNPVLSRYFTSPP